MPLHLSISSPLICFSRRLEGDDLWFPPLTEPRFLADAGVKLWPVAQALIIVSFFHEHLAKAIHLDVFDPGLTRFSLFSLCFLASATSSKLSILVNFGECWSETEEAEESLQPFQWKSRSYARLNFETLIKWWLVLVFKSKGMFWLEIQPFQQKLLSSSFSIELLVDPWLRCDSALP